MKLRNVEKMNSYLNHPMTSEEVVKELEVDHEDLDELIEHVGRKLSFLKVIRGCIPNPDVL
jgi:hypothetical protein